MKQSDALMKPDMRSARAKQFAALIMHALRDFLPPDGRIQQRICGELASMAYETNALIVNLPLEFDHLSELAAERAMRKKIMEPILVEKPQVRKRAFGGR